MAKTSLFYGKIRTTLLTGTAVMMLSGCSWVNDWSSGVQSWAADWDNVKAEAPPPPDSDVIVAYEKVEETDEPPKALPRSWGQEPVENIDIVEERRRLVVPARKVSYERVEKPVPVYANELAERDVNFEADVPAMQRIAALEQAVMDLQQDYNRMMPIFNELITTNERIQGLLRQLAEDRQSPPSGAPVPLSQRQGAAESMARQEPSAGEPVPAYAPPSTPDAYQGRRQAEEAGVPVSQRSVPAPASTVQDVRIGEHGNKTRLVLDLSDITEFDYDLDNNERLLIVQIPGAKWQGREQFVPPKSPLISSWTYHPSPGGGSALAIQLKKDARIVEAQSLPGRGGKPSRVFLDIAPSA